MNFIFDSNTKSESGFHGSEALCVSLAQSVHYSIRIKMKCLSYVYFTDWSSYTWNIICFHRYYRSKKLRVSFLQERVSICFCNSPIWFDFLKLSMVQECLKHPTGHVSFLQNKIFKIARFKCAKNSLQRIIFLNCPTLHWIRHFGCQIAKQFWKFGLIN